MKKIIKIVIKIVILIFLHFFKIALKPLKISIYLDVSYRTTKGKRDEVKKHRILKLEKNRKSLLELCFITYL